MMAYIAMTLLSVLIFLSISDAIPAMTKTGSGWVRARTASKKHVTR